MQKLSLDEIKNSELLILDDIDRVCRKNNIKYSLAFGTLIGAVRHKGFIPWDDDIDIVMTRDNYDKFIHTYINEKNENYSILNHEFDKNYYHQFTKVVDNRTTINNDNLREIKNMGVWVDVFPVDKISSKNLRLNLKLINFFQMGLKRAKGNLNTSKRNKLFKFLKRKIYVEHLEYWYTKTIKITKKINDNAKNDLEGVILTDFPKKYLFDRKMFNSYIDMEFEGHKFMCIKDYDKNLKEIYGDYMKLPPISERTSKHNIEAYKKEKV